VTCATHLDSTRWEGWSSSLEVCEAAPVVALRHSQSAEHLVTNCFTFPVIQHQTEVCPLSRGVMLPPAGAQPLSTSLQGGLRFLRHPLPAIPSARLAVCFPYFAQCKGRTTGLPRSACVPAWVRFPLYTGGTPSATDGPLSTCT